MSAGVMIARAVTQLVTHLTAVCKKVVCFLLINSVRQVSRAAAFHGGLGVQP